MAVYSKLLLSAGGGIISAQQQADQVENTATVLIGLGGTGVDALRTIKTQVYERLKPDDPEAVIKEYAHIRFLGVDSARTQGNPADDDDAAQAGSLIALDDTEMFSISNRDVRGAFTNTAAIQMRHELDWLRYDAINAPDLGDAGAGGIRQVGRYMMMDKSALFLSRIEQEIKAAKSGLSSPSVNVHIFSGLSGGTGSGCFLDVCYMVQHIAQKIGGVTTFGYFFLPDVNLSRIPDSDIQTREYVPRNGYAAMQELDYCMQLQYNGGAFVQEYQNHQQIKWAGQPVDMCHLVCATNEQGDVIKNAYDYAMNVTAEYVMDFLTRDVDHTFDLKQQLANFQNKIVTADGQKVIGTNLAYCVIGASCATIPMREINTYLASKLFGKFATIENHTPSKADVEALANRALANGTSDVYNSLYRMITEGADSSYAAYSDDWKYVKDYGNKDLVNHYTNQRAAKQNKVEANAKSLTTEGNERSLLGKLRGELETIIKDLDRGPLYAYRMLSAAESHNLLNIIDGLIAENTSRQEQEAIQDDGRHADYENAKRDFEQRRKRSLLDNDEKRFADYELYLQAVMEHDVSSYVYDRLGRVLKEFRKQVVDVTAEYYIKLGRVMETLINTFKENDRALSGEKVMKGTGSFAIPMMTIEELKPSLDEEIERINVPGMMDAFMQLLLDNQNAWILEDQNKITRLVTTFFVDTAFGSFANRSITAFLSDKYGTDNVQKLAQKIYNEWMMRLTQKASPLFYFNPSIWRASQTSRLAFISMPASSAPIKAAADMMNQVDNTFAVKESALTDRIYVMCSACALPLSAYNNCAEYERGYFSAKHAGGHYYESDEQHPLANMPFSDWRKLPSLTPQSMLQIDSAPLGMQNITTPAKDLYERAEAKRIFDDHNYICEPSAEAVAKIKTLVQTCNDLAGSISQPDQVAGAEQVLQELDQMATIPMIATAYHMKDDGFVANMESKLRVRKDHFVASPVYQMVVDDILQQMDDLEQSVNEAKERLQNKLKAIATNSNALVDYCDALFTGVISWDGPIVKYEKVTFGITEEITLSKRDAAYPFATIPVYQAFLSYQALDDTIKAEIKDLANQRINVGAPEITTTGTKLKDYLADERINSWAQRASTLAQRAEILELLGNVKKQFSMFCMDNML